MKRRVLQLLTLMTVMLFLAACNTVSPENENLINKINVVNGMWINYEGTSEKDKSMIQSQFIPYNSEKNYEVSHDTYISYFNGDEFIKTELYEDTPEIINSVEGADGIILSFNKEHKSGMQLTKTDEP